MHAMREMRITMMALTWAMPILLAVLGIAAGEQSSVHEGQAAESGTMAKAYFAGGCFWCMEEAFEKVDGVLDVLSGYMGGSVKNPSYEDVSAGRTGHAESVEVHYDPRKLTYSQLLEVFWRNVDPVTPEAQFCDHGNQYRAAIFYQGGRGKTPGRGIKTRDRTVKAVFDADCDASDSRFRVLSRRGIPSGLL
jgi:methionine-S-sulfoxide reductase